MALITLDSNGLHCPKGGLYIDPLRPVETALLTHAHSDHARRGSAHYYATRESEGVLRLRLGEDIHLTTAEYGEKFKLGEVWVSFHPAGHVLGSAQVRLERGDEVWVISGDYKREPDPTCAPFEAVPCGTFITEATFGLPVYAWRPGREVVGELYEWWQSDLERPSLVFGYAFGKAQRILAELAALTDRPVYLHGALARLTQLYREQGVRMVPTLNVTDAPKGFHFKGELVLAPPSAHRSPWMRRFKAPQTAFASGWMLVRGNRRRRGYERGFVLSDHCDWPGLIRSVEETKASRVLVTHGQSDVLARYLTEEKGIRAEPLGNLYGDEEGDGE
ncbi:MAG: DNA ligase-associated DEXH box helicase [Meiothermus sp.]|mgnify:FL=1